MKIPKPLFPLLAAVAAFAAFGALAPAHARAQVTVSFFYDSLGPYGEWVQDPDYGYVWHPTNVDENWAPYTDGYWAYTDSGWTWVSYEDYGGVVYHYGRWTNLPGEGWVWVPGYTWAPAWVSWRTNDDYVGWAPLPPEAHWTAGIGFSTWVDARFDIGPGFYSFVSVGNFGAPALGSVILSRDQNVTIINNTTNITNITVNNSNVYVGGPSYAKLAARSSRPIPTLKLVRQGDASLVRSQGGKVLSHQQGNQLVVLAPKITPNSSHIAPPKVAKTLTGVKPDNGWGVVKDPQERAKMETQFKSQAGSETTAAKPVNSADLKLVSDHIKNAPKNAASSSTGALSPKPGKIKNKSENNADLLNAPATEESGATSSETPKKGKSKKAKTPESGSTDFSADGTPIPKKHKSKKAATPADYTEGSASESETPAKHSKKSSDSNLQPFMSGDESSKSDKSSTEEPKVSDKSDKSYDDSDKRDKSSYESRPNGQEYSPEPKKSPKGEKSDKKKKKDDQDSQGQ